MFICDISIFNKYGKQKLDKMLSPMKIDWRELVVMLVIEQLPGITQARLTPFLQTDKANVTKLLQAMEKKNLIIREVDDQDQRNKICNLTKQGKELTPRLRKTLVDWEEACFQGVSKGDLEQYRRISDIITRNIVQEWKA
jgi:DNA-binding MarR family transcriptional regulator